MKSLIKFPKAKKFLINYLKNTQEIKTYLTSLPLDENESSITVYCQKVGIRTFKKNKIKSMKEISIKETIV